MSPSDTYVCMWIDHTPQGKTGLQQGHTVQDWSLASLCLTADLSVFMGPCFHKSS